MSAELARYHNTYGRPMPPHNAQGRGSPTCTWCGIATADHRKSNMGVWLDDDLHSEIDREIAALEAEGVIQRTPDNLLTLTAQPSQGRLF